MSQDNNSNNNPFHFGGSQIHRPSSTEINSLKKDYFSSLFNETPTNSFKLPEVTSPHIPFVIEGDGDMEIVDTKRETTPVREKQAIIMRESQHQLAQMESFETGNDMVQMQPTKPITMKAYAESSEENYQMDINNDENQIEFNENEEELVQRKESVFEEFEEMKEIQAALFQQAANMFVKAKTNLLEGTDEVLSKYDFALIKRAYQMLEREMDETISPEELRQLRVTDDEEEYDEENENGMEEDDILEDSDDDEIVDEKCSREKNVENNENNDEDKQTKMPKKPTVEKEEQEPKKEKKSNADK